MYNSIRIATFKIDEIEKTGYHTWIDFWLNEEAFSAELNRRMVRTPGGIAGGQFAFSGRLLESLVAEEFTMILEHLGCGTFEDFQLLLKETPGADVINVVVRAIDGSVYLREYVFNEAAVTKLSTLWSKRLSYPVWSEKVRG